MKAISSASRHLVEVYALRHGRSAQHAVQFERTTQPLHHENRCCSSVRDTTRFELTAFEPFSHHEPMLTYCAPTALRPIVRSREDASTTSLHRFPHNNFKYFLTLFSKFFSSFPHGTCSLSVSRHYLALEGIYLPIRAAFPSNPTRRKRVERLKHRAGRGSHPLRRRVPTDLRPGQVGQSPL